MHEHTERVKPDITLVMFDIKKIAAMKPYEWKDAMSAFKAQIDNVQQSEKDLKIFERELGKFLHSKQRRTEQSIVAERLEKLHDVLEDIRDRLSELAQTTIEGRKAA